MVGPLFQIRLHSYCLDYPSESVRLGQTSLSSFKLFNPFNSFNFGCGLPRRVIVPREPRVPSSLVKPNQGISSHIKAKSFPCRGKFKRRFVGGTKGDRENFMP